jgi:hypothetical protein
VNLQSEAYYLLRSVEHHLNRDISPGVAFRGTLAELGQPMKDSAYERLAKALTEFQDV